MRDRTVRRWSAIHRWFYRSTGGKIGRHLVKNDMLLLTTRGRLSGQPHEVPLLYLGEGERLVVIASYGGRPRHPDWYLNLLAEPQVGVQVEGKRFAATARVSSAAERDTWWPRIVAAHADYENYQAKTNRLIPVVFLEPARG